MKRNNNEVKFQMFRYDGDFYTYTGKVFDLLLIGIYWLIGCLFIVTIGASCCAMYQAIEKSILEDRETVTKVFWKTYKRELPGSIKYTVGEGLLLFILMANIGIMHRYVQADWKLFFMFLYALIGALIVMAGMYLFPALSSFQMEAGWYIKLSAYLTMKHLPRSLVMLMILIGVYYFILWMPLLVFVLPAGFGLVIATMISPVLKQHMAETETEMPEAEENK